MSQKEPPECEHSFTYGGVKYEVQNWTNPGSGSRPVYYFDWFYCTKCLTNRYDQLAYQGNSYDKLHFNATPKKGKFVND